MPVKRYKFKAKIEAAASAGGGGAYVLFPYDLETEFGRKGRVPVKALLNGVPYTGSLMMYGRPEAMLGVLKAVRAEMGKDIGDTIAVELWRDEAERKIEAPAEFAARMKREGLREFFDGLSYTHQKEYVRWVSEAKREETRARRLEKAVEMLRAKVKTPG
jgi:hypothetical protein